MLVVFYLTFIISLFYNDLWRKIIKMNKDLVYEKAYQELKNAYKSFENDKEESFKFFEGEKTGVIFSCPHAVSQTREGKIKMADINTGPLGIALNKLGYNVLIKTKNCGDDANYDKKSGFKTFLNRKIEDHNFKYLIDLHGMSKKRNVLIALGTCFGKNSKNSLELTNQFIKIAGKNGLEVEKIRIDFPFSAHKNTVSSYINRKNKIETLQMEINSKIFEDKKMTIELLRSLDEYAKLIKNYKNFSQKDISFSSLHDIDKKLTNQTFDKKPFDFCDKKSEILLAAPHASSMIKEDRECYGESYSGALALAMTDVYNISSFVKTGKTDYDSFDEYIDGITDVIKKNNIKLVVEFHVMNQNRNEDITIVTNQGHSINNNFEVLSLLLKTLTTNGLNNFSLDYPFNPYNLSSTVSTIFDKTNTPAFQFIINQRLFENKKKFKVLAKIVKEMISKAKFTEI